MKHILNLVRISLVLQERLLDPPLTFNGLRDCEFDRIQGKYARNRKRLGNKTLWIVYATGDYLAIGNNKL